MMGGGMRGMGGMGGGGMAGMGGMGGMGGMMGGGMMGGGMMGGGMRGMGGMAGMSGGLGGYGMNDGSTREVVLTPVPVEKASEAQGEPAQITIPYHMAIIEGAFPYREQMERFARALKYPSVQAMLADRERVFTDKNDKDPTIGFLGFNVVRRQIAPDGMATDWRPVDLATPYKLMRRRAVQPNHPEDPELLSYGIIVTQVPARPMVMRLPELVKEHGVEGSPHPGQEYPKFDLPEIRAALEKQKDAYQGKPPEIKASKNRYNTDPDDEIDDSQGPGPGGAFPGSGGMQEKMMSGGKPPPGGTPGAENEGGATGPAGETVLPEHCLFRLIDLTVQPGATYEYQVALVMANPLYKRLDVAVSRAYTRDQVMAGPPRLVTTKAGRQEQAIQVKMGPDLAMYAVEDKGEGREARKAVPGDKEHAPVQIQHWLDSLRLEQSNKDSEVLVGDWAILKRMLVQRGEYIGRLERVPVAYFDPKANQFVFATSPGLGKVRARKEKQAAVVDFDTHSILVDFEGGPGTRPQVNGRTVSDEAVPAEMLILALDPYDDSKPPKLLVRHGPEDLRNADRERRLKDMEAWQKSLKDNKEADKGDNRQGGGKKGSPYD
jgi:hypothetical protein